MGVFFDAQGFIHYAFISKGHTINKEMYTEILYHLSDATRKGRPEKWACNNQFLLHVNTHLHINRWQSKSTLPSTMWRLWSICHIPQICYHSTSSYSFQ
jgi:hypothetical protein